MPPSARAALRLCRRQPCHRPLARACRLARVCKLPALPWFLARVWLDLVMHRGLLACLSCDDTLLPMMTHLSTFCQPRQLCKDLHDRRVPLPLQRQAPRRPRERRRRPRCWAARRRRSCTPPPPPQRPAPSSPTRWLLRALLSADCSELWHGQSCCCSSDLSEVFEDTKLQGLPGQPDVGSRFAAAVQWPAMSSLSIFVPPRPV